MALVRWVDRIPEAPRPESRRGRPVTSSDRVFMQDLIIMIMIRRDLPTVHLLLSVVEQPVPKMQVLPPCSGKMTASRAGTPGSGG